jgi:hypothetical protein
MTRSARRLISWSRSARTALLGLALAVGLPGVQAAQSAVTTSDVGRLRDEVFEASTDLSRLRTGDSILLKALRAELDDVRVRLAALEARLERDEKISRDEFVAIRDEIQGVRRAARGERTVTGAGLGPAAPAPDPASIPTVTLDVPRHTRLDVRLLAGLDPATSRVDDRVEAATVKDLVVDGRVVVPAGSLLRGVVSVRNAPSSKGKPGALVVRFDAVTVDYRTHRIAAVTLRRVQRPLLAGTVVGVSFEQRDDEDAAR